MDTADYMNGTRGHTGMTIFLVVYGAFVWLADAVLKPLLIAKGAAIPLFSLLVG